MHGPDRLRQAKAVDVLDVACSKVEPWGAVWPALRRRRRCMEAVSDMAERASEADRHCGPCYSSNSWDSIPKNCAVSPTVDLAGARGTHDQEK